MYSFLHQKFYSNCLNIKDLSSILVAISGGQDSLCLIKLISDHRKKLTESIETIYVDHQWRQDSLINIKHIIHFTKKMGFRVAIYQLKRSTYSENETRKIRYQILVRHAMLKKCYIIMTGHHLNDLIETTIYNTFRGSSLKGLTNFKLLKHLNHKILIFRPLLNFTKTEINWFCRIFCLPIWSDNTNFNYSYRRNRIRYELWHYLNNYLNPRFYYTINRFIKRSGRENEYIEENAIRLYIDCQHQTLMGLNLHKIRRQHITLQERVIKLYFYFNYNQIVQEKIIYTIINTERIELYMNIATQKLYKIIIQLQDGWIYTSYMKTT